MIKDNSIREGRRKMDIKKIRSKITALIIGTVMVVTTALTSEFLVFSEETVYTTVNYEGVNYTYYTDCDGNNVAFVESSPEASGDIIILSEINGYHVWQINSNAFAFNKNITRVTIEEGIEHIGSMAFYDCTSLTNIYIPNSVKSIQDNVFTNTLITSIEIPDSVNVIGSSTFSLCSNLTDITLPNDLWIGSDAFKDTPWYNAKPDGMIYIGKIAYSYKGEMPENTFIEIKEGTKYIGESAFKGCDNLVDIIIPNGVIKIGGSAFEYCYSLTNINLPNSLIEIYPYAFYGCERLESISISYGTEFIARGAFRNCRNLTSVIIPNSVYYIKETAFGNCDKLTIYGYINSEAERYAEIYEIKFIPLNDVLILNYFLINELPTLTQNIDDINKDGKIDVFDLALAKKQLISS